jgi:hypothetical protein
MAAGKFGLTVRNEDARLNAVNHSENISHCDPRAGRSVRNRIAAKIHNKLK